MRTRRDILKSSAATIGAASLTWPISRVASAAEKPSVVVAIGTDVLTLDPHRIAAGADFFVAANIFEGLYGHDETGKLVPALAESADISPDGLKYTFVLRSNATFHDGRPVASDDVIASWKRANNPRNPFANVLVANIAGIEKVDDRKFTVALKRRDMSFLHNCETYWLITPRDYEALAESGKMIGTGPFKFVSRRVKEFIKLEGHERHWGRVPQIGSLTMKIVPDDQGRVAQIQSGESDLIANVPPVLARRIAQASQSKVITAKTLWFSYIHINALSNPSLKKRTVRLALNMAIDKDALNKTLMLNYATPTELLCRDGVVGCDVSVKPYGYDPKKARAMLEQEGFDFAKPLRFVGLAPGRVPQSREITEGIAYMLRQIGVQTEITMMEFGAWSAVRSAKEKDMSYDLIFGANGDFNNGDPVGRLLRQVRSGGSFAWYGNADIDGLIDRANDFSNEKEREENLRNVFSKLHEDVPIIPLWCVDLVYLARKGIDWAPTPNIQWPIFWNLKKIA